VTKRALSSSGVSVGTNTSDVIQRVMRNMVKKQDERDHLLRVEREKWAYDQREELWVFCKSHPQADGSLLWSAETVDQVPGVGAHARTDRYEATPKRALTELRMKLAKLWAGKKLCATYDEARERAARVVFQQAIISASDEAGS
jgi:hypothetical protein